MKKVIIAALALCSLYSCKNDDPDPVEETTTEIDLNDENSLTGTRPTFEPLDPATVSENIVLTNSTKITGSPSSTTDAGTPTLYDFEDDESLTVAKGSEFKIPLTVLSGDVAGYFVQVEGANEYFDIAKEEEASAGKLGAISHSRVFRQITGNPNARVGDEEEIEIEIPETIEAGNFCVLICVYDADGLVSLPITRCINVQSFGGEGAEFIVNNEWEFNTATYKEVEQGEEEIISVSKGEWDEWSGTTSIYCEATFDYQEFEYTSKDKINELTFNFTSNGGMEFVTSGESYDYNYENSSCETGLVYETEDYNDEETGAWSYDASTQTMTMLFDGYDDEDGYYYEPYFIDFKAQEVNNQLVLSYKEDYGDGDYDLFVFYFDKK